MCCDQDADHQAEVSNAEKEEIVSKLSQAEKIVADWKIRVNKLEEDNAKLRRAVEQSMTRLNRMSIDSDYLVDRLVRISIAFKLQLWLCVLVYWETLVLFFLGLFFFFLSFNYLVLFYILFTIFDSFLSFFY